ncbi:MAG: rhomboid family intramembrane serine protease [Pseudomonadota bacterium]
MNLKRSLAAAAFLVGLIWLVFFLNILTPTDLRVHGVQPRRLIGLRGIPLAPFLHADAAHLVANTGALFVLLTIAFLYSFRLTLISLALITVLEGGAVWLFGAPGTVHLGASGLIFGLIGHLLFSGVFRRDILAAPAALLVLFLYGGMILYNFIPTPGVSWTGHVFGFLAGILAAWLTRNMKKN